LKISRSPLTGLATFVTAADGGAIPMDGVAAGAAPQPIDFLRAHGNLFGVDDPARQLVAGRTEIDAFGLTHTTFSQVHNGVPVFGGVLKTHQDRNGEFKAANGHFFAIARNLSTQPRWAAAQAEERARILIGRGAPRVEHSELVIIDPGWYGDPPAGAHLAHHLILEDLPAGIREAFFIDAQAGKVLDRWNLLHTARDRVIIDDPSATVVRTEGGIATGDFDADAAYDYSGDYYDYLFRSFARDSIDDAGTSLFSTVHLISESCANAFGGTGGTFYCDGVVTDDIVAHEFTHGLTGFTANLIYQNQSGQLNESFSDVFGEIIDLLNGDAAVAGPPGGTPWPAHGTGPGTDTPNSLRTVCVSSALMVVNSPGSIAGDYAAQPAAFGPPVTVAGITGDVVVADPVRGCDADLPFANAGDMAGKIVLMDRGTCFFTEKVLNAQDEGAIAVIIANNLPFGRAPMGGSDPNVTIPSVGISQADGQTIKDAVLLGTVNATLRDADEIDVRWLVGEDSAGFGGHIRDMWLPSCEGDPDTANHPLQTCSAGDNGGVHSGSGVPNHAFAIATDGKTFNGYPVAGIGLFKTGAVWYRALTVYLTPFSDFGDAYVAFNQAATDLVGQMIKDPRDGSNFGTFTAADAMEVDKALLAVELNTLGLCGANEVLVGGDPPSPCEPGTMVFFDDLESGVNGWTVSVSGPSGPPTPYNWGQATSLPLGEPGTAWFANDPNLGDCGAVDESAVHSLFSPTISVLANEDWPPYAQFRHFVATESGYDGGNVKISINGGAWQIIPSSEFFFNAYNRSFVSAGDGNTNPLAGEEAWSGGTPGVAPDSESVSGVPPLNVWGTSVIALDSFVVPGDDVRFRFDFGKDGCSGVQGWYVDDFLVYLCDVITDLGAPTVGDNTCQTTSSNTGIPCSTNAECTPPAVCGLKSRYLSVTPNNQAVAGGAPTSIRIRVVSAPQFPQIVGHQFYVGPEQSIPNAPNAALRGAPVGCVGAGTPHSQVWTSGVLHLFGAAIVPSPHNGGVTTYAISHCDVNGNNCGSELNVAMAKWGDVSRPFGGGSQPNFTDIYDIVAKFAGASFGPSMARADLIGVGNPGQQNTPNQAANFADVSADVAAFTGLGYPYTVPSCPP